MSASHRRTLTLVGWLLVMSLLLQSGLTQAGALHQAARAGNLTQVRQLLAHGAKVNAVDQYGFTPLLLAQLNNHRAVAQLLANHGARVRLNVLIRRLQYQLRYLGYQPGPADGRLGSKTRSAIRAFQQHLGVPTNDRFDEQWVAALQRQVRQRLQRQLKQAGLYRGPVDGQASPQTSAAIRAFQRQRGLAPTGRLSSALLRHLAAGHHPAAPARTPGAIVLSGSALIRAVQQELDRLGYPVGRADGRLGPQTRNAIRAFQRQQGLPPSGQPSTLLLTRLRNASPTQAVAATAPNQRSVDGNIEVEGPLKLEHGPAGQLLGCSVGQVQLDRVWCRPFAARSQTWNKDCRVVIRPSGAVIMVKCH